MPRSLPVCVSPAVAMGTGQAAGRVTLLVWRVLVWRQARGMPRYATLVDVGPCQLSARQPTPGLRLAPLAALLPLLLQRSATT